MPIENLIINVENLKSEYLKTDSKRHQWTTTTVPLLKDVFQKLLVKFDLDWNFHIVSNKNNLGAVTLSFNKTDSGISETTENGLGAL